MGNSNAGRRVDGFVAAGLPTLRCPFLHDGHVAVDGQPGKAVHALAWRWPVDFQPIHLLALAQAENHSGVMTRHEASSGALEKAANSPDRKSTRLNSSHDQISYAVFCLKKKKKTSKAQHHRQLH